MAKSGNAGIEFECSRRTPALLEAMLWRHTGKGIRPVPLILNVNESGPRAYNGFHKSICITFVHMAQAEQRCKAP